MSTIVKKDNKIRNRNFRTMVERYASANEVASDCRRRDITNARFNDMTQEHMGRWEGVESYDEAIELLRHGYQPVVNELKANMKTSVRGTEKRISFRNDIVGYAPVVPLALKGVPNSMVNMTMKRIKSKVIDVYYDMTCSSATDSDDIIAAGSKLLGVILKLEQQGYKFNLYALQTYSDDNSADVLAVKVKSSDQPLDLKRISFPLAHTAFFRVIGFDWYSRCPEAKYRSAYGRALAYVLSNEEQKEWAHQIFGDNALYISATNINRYDEDYLQEVLLNGKNKN